MSKVFIVTGPKGSGKSTLLLNLAESATLEGYRVGGIIARGYWQDGLRSHYELIDMEGGETRIFCQASAAEGWEPVGRFYINPEALSFGFKIFEAINFSRVRMILLDEIGPFELLGKGWALPFQRLLNQPAVPLVISVRTAMITEVLQHWNIDPAGVFDVNKTTAMQLLQAITGY